LASERVQSQLIHEKMLEIFHKGSLMKTRTLQLTLSLAALLSWQIPSQAQWVQTNGPHYGGISNCFAVSGTNLFVSTISGVFLSTNNGRSWSPANTPFSDFSQMVESGTNLFAGTSGGVFLSTDNGTSWVNAGRTPPVIALAVSGTNLYAGTPVGLFLSTDNGTSWTETGLICTLDNCVGALAVIDTNLFAGMWDGGVFLSTNNGTSWTKVNNGLPFGNISAFAVSPAADGSGTNLFAGTCCGVFLSTDNGTSWIAVNNGLPNTSVGSLIVSPVSGGSGTNLFVSNYVSVFRSIDNGASWTKINNGLMNQSIHALAVSGPNLLASTDDGVFLSPNNGESWVNSGLICTDVVALAVIDTNLFAGTSSGVCLSTDNGASWTKVNSGLTTYWLQTLAVSGTNLFAGTNDGVFFSTNNGTSWTEVNNGLTKYYDVRALAVSGMDLFAGIFGGVLLSTNSGTSWTAIDNGLTTWVNDLAVCGTNLFAGTGGGYWGGGGVYHWTHNGTSWTAVNSGLTDTDVYALAVSGTNLFASTFSDGVFLSTDNDTSWSPASTPFSNFSQMVENGTNLFAGTDRGVFLSTDNGTSWTEVNTGLKSNGILSLVISGTNLFAGTGGNGVWRRPLSEMILTSVEESSADRRLPENFSLEQNYPNPFNPTTTINYTLPKRSNVTLTVFNLMGQEVIQLVEGEKEAGFHEMQIDGSHLNSGVYFCRLQADGFTQARKMMIVK
jgi:ligand-binding sensor domain-containing protein